MKFQLLLNLFRTSGIKFVNLTDTMKTLLVLYDFSVTVKAAPHECVIRTGHLNCVSLAR